MARSKYETHVLPRLEEIMAWYETLNESQIAYRLGISVRSFEKYKNEHEELRECLRYSRDHLIEDLKKTLKMKARGFIYTEKKESKDSDGYQKTETFEKYALPDLGAIHLLLKNLDPEWRNDDQTTIDLKRQRLELDKEKAESNNW